MAERTGFHNHLKNVCRIKVFVSRRIILFFGGTAYENKSGVIKDTCKSEY